MQENDRTYYDDEKLFNANITSKAAKAAKLSSIKTFRAKTEAIKEKLRSEIKKEEPTAEVAPIETTPEMTSVPENPEVSEQVKEEDNIVQFPTKESLEERISNASFYGYNNIRQSRNLPDPFKKLRVAPQVVKFSEYAIDVLGGEKTIESSEINNEVSANMPVENTEETPKAFDFSALPGVGETHTNEESYDDYHNLEQDNRLNDYLNRENGTNEDIATNLSEIEEIRKLKREIEEAKESLQQVKANVGDLQQKDNEISEQLAMYKQSLMEQRDQVNAELVDQTREWNDLTQLVKQKEALIGDNESFGMNRAA